MSKKVSLSSPLSKKKLKESNTVSLGNGECEFPFIYKGDEYKECIKNKKGELICATERYPSKKLKKFAYCVDTPKKNNVSKKMKFKVSSKFNPKTINKQLLIPTNEYILPSSWELPNRQTYPAWFSKSYNKYKAKKGSFGTSKKSNGFNFFMHQKLIKDYLNADSPYRGLLLYHGLGVGKTCASIAISECFRNNRDIVVLLNKSLVKNFKDNLMKCGYELFRTNQNWEFHKITDSKDPMMAYAKTLGIPKGLITKNNGAWFINFSKPPNYDSLSDRQQISLNNQIYTMINAKYTFKHIDGLTRTDLERMNENKFFDNKLVIVDEVHNITNAMSKPTPGIRGSGLKKLIMNATNLKLVFLSGTPMINNLFESAQLFNLLRGYIHNFQFTLTKKTGPKPPSFNKIVDELKKINLIDQLLPKKSDNIINIVRNPTGFVTSKDGVIRSEDNNITDSEFVSKMKTIFSSFNYNVSVVINKYTTLPDNELEFMNLFYNESKNQIKNPLLLQSRILGLVSYFRIQGTGLLPTVTKNEIVHIPMSNYQFLAYSLVRKGEIDQDKSKKGSKSKGSSPKKSDSTKSESSNNLFEDKSSYRAYSRMHCSFVFPESVPRPSKKDAIKVDVKEQIEDFNALLKKYKVDSSLTTQLRGLKIDTELEGLTAQLTIIDKALEDESRFETYTALENVKTELEELIGQKKVEQINIDIEDDKGDELDVSPVIKKKVDKSYEKSKIKALKKLDEEKNNLFKINDPEQLEKYSPKYNHIIKMCNSINGLSFIYTEYKTLEGIAILKISLKANGYAEFKLKESSKGYYEIDIDKSDIGKPMFSFWGGDVGMSDIIRRVYNNQFDELPVNIKKQLEKLFPSKNNIRGDIIKILMTTKSGAEGIDLQNVRQVHIVEPYWNPVRTEQVKGRAVRVGSHLQLPEKDRTVEIYTYLSVIKKENLDSDITIKDDKNGMSSDEVLFEISQKKLEVMNHFLTLIKEASVDCNININETRSKDNYFECVKYGSKVTRNDYSFIPNIQGEHNDSERKRRVQTTQSEYDFKLLPINGKNISFAVRIDNSVGEHIALYDSQKTELGEIHEPLAEFNDKTKKLTLLNKKLFKKYISK